MDKKKILVVEDEFVTASDIKASLEGLGFEVAGTVDTGEEAVKAAGQYLPDVILMDIILKGEMNGITAAVIIRQKFDIPVIYLTGQSDDATINRALESEPFGYIVKPFNERNLKTSITMALYKHTLDEKLKDSEHITRALLNATGDPMFMIDRETSILVMNDSFTATHQTAGTPASGQTLDSLVAGGLISPKLAGMVQDHFNDKKPFRFEEEMKGKWFDHRITPLLNHHGEIIRCAIHSHDITDIKRNEQDLRQFNDRLSQEKSKLLMFEAAVNGMDDNVIITDSVGEIVFINTAAQKHFSYTQDEIQKQHISILKAPEDLFDISKSRFIEDRKNIWTGNFTAMSKHKVKIKTTLKSSLITHENQPLYRVFVLRERFQ